MSDNPIVFIHDGEQWLNVGLIESIVDRTDADKRRRTATVGGREYTSEGTASELILELERVSLRAAGLNPADFEVDLTDRFPGPGRRIGD